MKNRMFALFVGMGLLATGSVVTAHAADLPIVPKAPIAAVNTWNPWMIRVRALAVLPRDSGYVDVVGVGRFAGSDLSYSNSVVPELDISYFFTPNFAAELILGVTPHKIHGAGTLNGLEVGKTWLLPPTLTFQYHFTNFGAFKPYIGVGANYTVMFSQSAANTLHAPTGFRITSLDVHNAFGGALQAGFDYMIDRHWGLNFDVKKLFLRPGYDAVINNAVNITGKANLDPWLVAGGVTYKF